MLPKCRLLNGLATLAYYAGRYDESKTLAGQALVLGREIGDLPQIAAASVLLTFNPKPDEDPRLIMARYDEIRSIALALGDGLLLARNLNNLAEWHRNKGHVAEAAARYEESLAIHRELKNPGMITVVLCNYARLLLGQGDTVRGRGHLGEAFAVATANGLRGMDEHLSNRRRFRQRGGERAARPHVAFLARMRRAPARSVDERSRALPPAPRDARRRGPTPSGAALAQAALDERNWLARESPDD